MAGPKQILRQRDFSGGQLDATCKRRDDEPVVRSGAREARNVRVLPSGGARQRPGRTIRFSHAGRVDQVRMSPTAEYKLCFGSGTLTVRDSSNAVIAKAWNYAWTTGTYAEIVWDVYDKDVFICFPGQVMKIARWDGATGWSFLDYATTETAAGRRLAPFYRIARPGITMSLSALTGSVTATFSEPVLNASHVGARFRYMQSQITITAVTAPTVATATVNEGVTVKTLTFTGDVTGIFFPGDIIEGSDSGYKMYVTSTSGDDATGVSLNAQPQSAEVFVGPNGNATWSASANETSGPAISVWDEEVMSAYRGYPRSVTVDQNRVILCDFPGVPGGASWSRVGDPYDLYIGAEATDGFFELVPGKSRVYHVRPGADEFVFTDLGIYYIPISVSNPLRPGSVVFQRIPGPPSSRIEPVATSYGTVYVGTGLDRVIGIVGTGQTAQPYLTRSSSDLHSDLFNGVTCIEIEDSGGQPPDDRVYAVNADGSVVVGRYDPGKQWVGWVPWDGDGEVAWINSLGSELLFSTTYAFGSFCEAVDPDVYLDACIPINDIPTALASGAQAAVAIHPDQGTRIGNMTGGGGLAAAFDNTTSSVAAVSASLAASATSYIGKTFGQRFRIAGAVVWPSSNLGFTDQANITMSLRAKQGAAPVDPNADGTELAILGPIVDTTSFQSLASSDATTEWDHGWIRFQLALGVSYCAEVRFTSPGETNGTGDLWFYEDASVSLMDGRKYFGDRTVSDGEVDVQPADDFSDETVVAGVGWDVVVEPFLPHAQPGQDIGQVIDQRALARVAVAVSNSTGFRVEKWNPNSEEWDELNDAFTPYRSGESQDAEPPAREEANKVGAGGSAFDPRWRVTKTFPGPVTFEELTTEIGS